RLIVLVKRFVLLVNCKGDVLRGFIRLSLVIVATAASITNLTAARADDAFAAPTSTPPRESPRDFKPFAQVETHRIRITNAIEGEVQVSTDAGATWAVVGN